MSILVTVDFGSTYTKLTAIDMVKREIVANTRSFTTVDTHLKDGFDKGLADLKKQLPSGDIYKIVASSSAAGGLKMIAVGLVPSLTANAAKMAAASAGAKVIKTYAYELSKEEQTEIEQEEPDIILLSGGIDGGNKDVIIHNATKLAEIQKNFSVIVSGNKSVNEEVADILIAGQKDVIITENVMPEFGKLNIQPARAAIRQLFIDQIIDAKGLSDVQAIIDEEIIPTPLAVYEACEHLSVIGELMAVDVGGATTDVYSMSYGYPTKPNVTLKGLPEPFAKRSVEGDLGMRYSQPSLIEEAGLDAIANNTGIDKEKIIEWKIACQRTPELVSDPASIERKIDEELASQAVDIAMKRHCGTYEMIYTPVGEMYVQMGKDLTKTSYFIGAGGMITGSENAKDILKRSFYSNEKLYHLLPIQPRIIIDKRNILTAMGLLARQDKQMAIEIMKNEYGL